MKCTPPNSGKINTEARRNKRIMYPTNQSAITYNHLPNITQDPPPSAPKLYQISLEMGLCNLCSSRLGQHRHGFCLRPHQWESIIIISRSLLSSPVSVSDVMADQCRYDEVCAWYMVENDAREKSIVIQWSFDLDNFWYGFFISVWACSICFTLPAVSLSVC